MPYIPNGSGLYVPDTGPFHPKRFSVMDGTGYTPRITCKETGFGSGSDKLIYPDPNSANWSVTAGGFWVTSPDHMQQHSANAYVGTYMTAQGSSAFGDQWCGMLITTLFGANNLGVGIGPMVRYTTASNSGYYVQGLIDTGGNHQFEIGTFIGGSSSANISFRVAWDITTQPFILVKATGTGSGINVVGYAGTLSDFLNNTLTVMTSFTPTTFLRDTGIPGAVASSGTNGRDDVVAIDADWLAGLIDAC
jgi:hypothetical protein